MAVAARDALREASERLAAAGVDSPRPEARRLLAFVTGGPTSAALPGPESRLAPPLAERFAAAIARREAREPYAYIAGHREFYGLDFEVDPSVLIPRPDTEILVAATLARLPAGASEVVDMGTGSGCIAVAIAVHAPGARLWAVDISGPALEVCSRNAARHGAGARVIPVPGDLWRAGLPEALRGHLDAVVSNPPYVTAAEWARLEPEVRMYEPKRALVPEIDDPYPPLAAGAVEWLRRGGWLLCEVGAGRAAAVEGALRRAGFRHVGEMPDLAGIPRVVYGQRP